MLHSLGYYFGRGERRNILHESPNNAKLQGDNDVPNRLEVFLDESYSHLHHTSNKTWVPHQGVVLEPGRWAVGCK